MKLVTKSAGAQCAIRGDGTIIGLSSTLTMGTGCIATRNRSTRGHQMEPRMVDCGVTYLPNERRSPDSAPPTRSAEMSPPMCGALPAASTRLRGR